MDAWKTWLKVALILPVVALLTGCTAREGGGAPAAAAGPTTGTRKDGNRVYFSVDDPKGDDKGPGRYSYPISFDGRFGFLDITHFQVEDAGDFVSFLVEFRRPIDRQRPDGTTEAKNYWLQLVDIYIDTDAKPESGYSWALPGRNLQFDERSGWEKVVLVSPGHTRSLVQLIRNRASDQQLYAARHDIVVPQRVYPQAYTLKVLVPKSELGGEPQAHWGYQVMAMGYDPRNLAYGQLENMQVQRFEDQDSFGGGSDYQGDTNVIDLLAPTKEEQYRWLSNYAARQHRGSQRFATVPMLRLPGGSGRPGGSAGGAAGPPAPSGAAAPDAYRGPSEPAPPGPAGYGAGGSPGDFGAAARPQATPPEPAASRIDPRYASPPQPTGSSASSEFSFELDPGVKD